jgi:uncharacterized membrane protein
VIVDNETRRMRLSLAENENVSYYSTVYGLSLVALFVTGLIRAIIFVKVKLKMNIIFLKIQFLDFSNSFNKSEILLLNMHKF